MYIGNIIITLLKIKINKKNRNHERGSVCERALGLQPTHKYITS